MITENKLANAITSELTFHSAIFGFKVWGNAIQRPGLSDFILCVDGRFVAVELKIKPNKLTKLQKAIRGLIIQAGGVFILIEYDKNNDEVNFTSSMPDTNKTLHTLNCDQKLIAQAIVSYIKKVIIYQKSIL